MFCISISIGVKLVLVFILTTTTIIIIIIITTITTITTITIIGKDIDPQEINEDVLRNEAEQKEKGPVVRLRKASTMKVSDDVVVWGSCVCSGDGCSVV